MADSSSLPDYVKNFVLGFHQSIQDQNVSLIVTNYEVNWNKLTERYFKQSEWPTANRISHLVDNDETFLFLYKELYFRHLYTKLPKQVTLEHRIAAWENYTKFFDLILADEQPLELPLPSQWIWDMVDEFVYQFQEYSHFQTKIKDRSPQEIEKLKSNPGVWSIIKLFTYLHRIAEKSNIKITLEREKRGLPADKSNPFATDPFWQFLGFFSQINLSRLHCITGDYYMALKCLDGMDIYQKKGIYAKSAAYITTLYYHTGFAYLMTRRYQDAIKAFAAVLLYMSRMKQYHTKQYDQKKMDKMFTLLVILQTFCPKKIDEHLTNVMRQEHAEKLIAMQNKDVEQLFCYACPKFVHPSPPDFSGDFTSHTNPTATQCKLFLKEMNQQLPLISNNITSYLKIYKTLSFDKLGALLERKIDRETLRTYLIRFLHKSHQVKWSPGLNPSQGHLSQSSYIHFTIDKDMILVSDEIARKKYAETFLRNFTKLDEITIEFKKRQKEENKKKVL